MEKLYRKNELYFSLALIGSYIMLASVSDNISVKAGLEKSVTAPVLTILSAVIILFINRNGLRGYYGLVKPEIPAKNMIYYIPLMFLCSCNLWYGIRMNYSLPESTLHVLSMLGVGFLEEVIFRGFLFRAIQKTDGMKSAVIISSVTFGIGHIINLFTGSALIPTICQIGYAVIFGYLFCMIFLYTKSILPCIICHGILNALSAFSAPEAGYDKNVIVVSLILAAVSLLYAFFITRKLRQ